MSPLKHLLAFCIGSALSITGFTAVANEGISSIEKKQEIVVPKSVLVIFRSDSNAQDRFSVFNADGDVKKQIDMAAKSKKGTPISHPFMTKDKTDKRFQTLSDGKMAKITVPAGMTVADFIAKLTLNPAVEFVIEDKLIESKATPNDPLFVEQASLHQPSDQDLDAPEAWDISTGSKDVVVAVIDTGIDYSHPDLAANMWNNPDEIPNDGIDNDNNGYVDDVYGIDTWNRDSDPIDGNDHGTNVAGIIGAVGNNNLGMTGINHDVSLVACKAFSDDRGGSTSSIYECMNYLLALKIEKGVNIRVTNNSYSQEKDPVQDAEDIAVWAMMVEKFADEDILFVVAASNEFSDNDVITQMPGNLTNNNVITVASTMHNGRFAYSHSNYGLNTVHIGAPGVAVTSTESLLDNPNQPYYPLLQGTSFATPHVAGAAALALSINPDLSAVALKTMLMDTGDKLPSLEQKTISGKRVNLHKMLIAANPIEHLGFEVNEQVEIIKGQNNSIALNLVSKNGFAQSANISVVAPVGINASLSHSTGQDGQSVNLLASADNTMPVGDHTITLTANGFEQDLNVEVLPGALQTVSLTAQTLELTPWLPDGLSSSVELTDDEIFTLQDIVAYDVKVVMDIDHEKVGELDLYLVSPSGTKVQFLSADGIFHTHRDIREVFHNFRGELAVGTWTIEVFDNAGGPWLDLDKIVGAIAWTLEVQAAGGNIIDPPLSCDVNPTQPQCIESCQTDNTQAHCLVLCQSPDAANYNFCDADLSNELTPGVAVYVSAANKEQKLFTIDVNEAVAQLSVNTSGNNGDADLFISQDAANPTNNLLCRSRGSDSNESCTLDNPSVGTYFVTVEAYSAFDNIALVADLVPIDNCGTDCCETGCCEQDCCEQDCCEQGCGGNPTVLLDESNLSSSTEIVRQVELPAGKTLTVSSIGGSGDADLMVKFGQQPVLWDKDCYSGSSNNDEVCTITNTQQGTYFIVLESAQAFNGVTLTASYE